MGAGPDRRRWSVLRANDRIGKRQGITAGDIWANFGVRDSSDVGRRLVRDVRPPHAAGSAWFGRRQDTWIADPRFMHSRIRRELVARRDTLIKELRRAERDDAFHRPIRHTGSGQVAIAARLITPRWALRATAESGRAMVLVTAGEESDDPHVIGLSVPDARALVGMLERALDIGGIQFP